LASKKEILSELPKNRFFSIKRKGLQCPLQRVKKNLHNGEGIMSRPIFPKLMQGILVVLAHA